LQVVVCSWLASVRPLLIRGPCDWCGKDLFHAAAYRAHAPGRARRDGRRRPAQPVVAREVPHTRTRPQVTRGR